MVFFFFTENMLPNVQLVEKELRQLKYNYYYKIIFSVGNFYLRHILL